MVSWTGLVMSDKQSGSLENTLMIPSCHLFLLRSFSYASWHLRPLLYSTDMFVRFILLCHLYWHDGLWERLIFNSAPVCSFFRFTIWAFSSVQSMTWKNRFYNFTFSHAMTLLVMWCIQGLQSFISNKKPNHLTN